MYIVVLQGELVRLLWLRMCMLAKIKLWPMLAGSKWLAATFVDPIHMQDNDWCGLMELRMHE
jgi:hypothetical protein